MTTIQVTLSQELVNACKDFGSVEEVLAHGLADKQYRKARQAKVYAAQKVERQVIKQLRAEHPELFAEVEAGR